MKKIFYAIVTFLEVGFLLGTYIIDYFTVKKLGMVRWVNFTCMGWERDYPISVIRNIVIVILLLLLIVTLIIFLLRRSRMTRLTYGMMAVTLLLTAISIGYILLNSFATMRAYYFICMMLSVATMLQIGKTLVGIITR